MMSDKSELKVHVRRSFEIMIKTSYTWICDHPFLLAFVGFLYLLNRTCPLLFSALVVASPVLVCTLVLLGTILSFGEPNIPEIEKEQPETVYASAPFRAEVSRDGPSTVVERSGSSGESFNVERFVGTKEKDVVLDGKDVADGLVENLLSEVDDDGRPFDYRPLVDETLDEVKRDTQVRFEERAFVVDVDKKGDGEEQSRQVMMDDSKEDQMDVSPVSPWRPMRHEEDEDDDADDSLDSGSDGAESSSPDPSMTDIIPMLDELHPLLHTENPGRGGGGADLDGSDAASEGPHRSSSDEGMESDVDSESHGEEGDNENEEEDEEEEEEEEKKEEKDDESKSAIKWTEADQKNVMDLGSLELERNQRLENLIARRRARHNMRIMAEKNLIDFDSADVPFNMPPISTARNPFDLPYDPYDDMDIPGSAPSIMFARKNPFDSPYDPNEEKSDVKGEGFEEEMSSQQPKDQVFRRHESFSVGPSMLGGPRHDRLRPFFVLERLANEGTSYYPYERQLSEVSESKVSSVPDTESVCTILEDDEKKVDEQDDDGESKADDMASDHDDEEKTHSAASDHDEEKNHSASDHDEEKSHSSEDSDSDDQGGGSRNLHHHDVAEIVLGSPDTHHEESNMSDGETSDKSKHDEEEDSSDSDSSLSETEEETGDVSENEAMMGSERKDDLHEESETSSQPSFRGLEINVPRGVDDDDDYNNDVAPAFITAHPSMEELAAHDLSVEDQHVEPVYDTSPRSGSRFPSFSSVSSDYKPDLPGKEVQENADHEGETFSESIGGPAEIHSTSDETERITREVGESSAHEEVKEAVDTRARDVSESLMALTPPAEEEVVSSGMLEQHFPVEHVTTLEESPDVVHDIAETSANRSISEEGKQKDEATPQTFNADIPIDSYSTLSSGAVEYAETHSFNDEDVSQSEQDPVQSSVPNQTMDIEVDSVNASAPNVGSEETTPYESDRELTWSDKSVVEQSSPEHGEDQAPARAAPVSVVFSRNITFHEYHDAPEDTADLSCLTSESSSSPAESPEYKTPMVGEGSRAEYFQETVYDELDHVVERLDQLTDLHAISQTPPEVINEEPDEIKEIDEGLLSELDTIGDFSVKEVVTDSEPGPSSIGSDTVNEITEALPVLEARSVEDIESTFQQINEGSEVEDVILPSTVQDQVAQENYGTESELTVVEAASKDDLDTAMNQAVEESMSKQLKSPESEGGSGEVRSAVETESPGSSVEGRSLDDETNVLLNKTPEKEEKEEGSTSDVTRSLEEISKPSEPKEGMAMEVISERVVIPAEAIDSSNVTVKDEGVTKEAKAETSSNADVIVTSHESKETPETSEQEGKKGKEKKEKKKEEEEEKKSKSKSSSSSSSSSSSDSD